MVCEGCLGDWVIGRIRRIGGQVDRWTGGLEEDVV
jgi:hypothetical protein